ncbi:sulfite exporter TauE/SafE family protein [bacterium]|nr:sulfite exporter TauE/SafE family protein [bacterium]
MIALVATVFVAALVGGAHCAGMCGPLAAFCAGSSPGSRTFGIGSYQLGRLVSYAVLGAIAGAAGHAFDLAGALAGWERPAAIVAGSLMVAWGVVAFLVSLDVRVPGAAKIASRLGAPFKRVVARISHLSPATRGAGIGLVTGCLPCGWLYAFVLVAAGTGSAISGVAVMAAFWLGTAPWLVGVAAGWGLLTRPLRRFVPAAAAVLLIVLGVYSVVHRGAVSFETARNAAAATHVDDAGDAEPVCH